MTPRAVLWDLDGTLVDSEPLHIRSTDDTLAELGLTAPSDFNDNALGLPAPEVHRLLVQKTGLTLDQSTWEARRLRRFRAISGDLNTRAPAARIVADLARRGVPQALVSNSSRAEVDLALAATGLGAHLSVTVSLSNVQRGKPDPEGYLAAACALGIDPARCLVVEDSVTGAEAGLAAGMQVIFHPQQATPPPKGVIHVPPDGDLAAQMP
ncbi:MAG: HAD family phosphatase [Pseudomonadota bacterium]